MFIKDFYPAQKTKSIGIVLKEAQLRDMPLATTHYLLPIAKLCDTPPTSRMVGFGAYTPPKGKLKAADRKLLCNEILESADTMGIEMLIVAEPSYFEYLSGTKGLEKAAGLKFNCAIEGYEHITVLPMLNYQALEISPNKRETQDKMIATIVAVLNGKYRPPTKFEFKRYTAAKTREEIRTAFKELHTYDALTVDIETTGLHVGVTDVLTIAFGIDDHSAISMPIHPMYGTDNSDLLKEFFDTYKGRKLFHIGLFDAKHLIYTLYMKDFDDVDGMLAGLTALEFDDTMIYTYLATNSTDKVMLGLKVQSYDLLGDYAEDVTDATQIPLDDLLVYNAKDVCGTWYVYNKHIPTVIADEQLSVYENILKPSFRPLLQMMLNGLPIDLAAVIDAKLGLVKTLEEAQEALSKNVYVKEAVRELNIRAADKYNATHVSQKKPSDFSLEFNPNSADQLRLLLFDVMGFDSIGQTATKQPSTRRAVIQELYNTEASEAKREVLKAIIDVSQVAILLNTFISAFEQLTITQNGQSTLHGSLKIGTVQSGRLSSSDPNLQNLPSNSTYGKLIKSCFKAPEGFLWASADFSALNISGAIAA